ncbi:TRAP transporter substrate-binding protein [Paracoccus sp. SCSIO 75233]|uniref:TRAP transporter substrate-binding protein n=1 Tax=Paracoccus sp. SCSIO 75233 TaxID=3017782 RepID=UPI0022F0DCD2|nr:TRAP transporter substrate-binding protein [Paracoccus sp. SCSIO 75233]WBU52642.1 TRAP transporter substrate-binding protein [Paracoccus sp. SCSIO 75233]
MKFVAFCTAALTTATSVVAVQAAEWNFALTPPLESHYGAAATTFAEQMAELSGGDITVNVKAGGVLGGEREMLEGMQIGTIELGISSTGPIGNFIPETYALDFPFLFDSYESARAVLDGEIGQELLDKFSDVGLVGLAWGENGFRNITSSRGPISSPADVEGLKIRTMENEVHLDAFSEMGAAPTPMSWTEVITSLQQGTIDAQENPIPIIVANNLWEVQPYASMTQHVYSPAVIVMSQITWDGLSEEQQGWVREAAKAAAAADRAVVDQNEADGVAMMRENGMEVVEDVDKEAFAAAVQPTYDKLAEEYGVADLVDRIRAAQE